MLERYNIFSLKNVQDAGAKLDEWSKKRNRAASGSGSKQPGGRTYSISIGADERT